MAAPSIRAPAASGSPSARNLIVPICASAALKSEPSGAEQPPCAFTKFATCPFPPKGNHLPLYVTAGEWNPHYEADAKQDATRTTPK